MKKRPWRRKNTKRAPIRSPSGTTPKESTVRERTRTRSSIDTTQSLAVRMYVHRESKRQKVIMSMDLFSENEHIEMKMNKSIVISVQRMDGKDSCFVRNYRDVEWIERGSRLRGLPHDAKISIYSGIASKFELQAESLVSIRLREIKSMELDFAEGSLDRATSADVWGVRTVANTLNRFQNVDTLEHRFIDL